MGDGENRIVLVGDGDSEGMVIVMIVILGNGDAKIVIVRDDDI